MSSPFNLGLSYYFGLLATKHATRPVLVELPHVLFLTVTGPKAYDWVSGESYLQAEADEGKHVGESLREITLTSNSSVGKFGLQC